MEPSTQRLLAAAKLAMAWEEGEDCGPLTVNELCDRLRAAIADVEGQDTANDDQEGP